MEVAAALIACVVILAVAAIDGVIAERHVREQQAVWRSLHPPSQADDEEEEEWASRAARK